MYKAFTLWRRIPFHNQWIYIRLIFCDRVAETGTLTRYITNGNNVALISSRRLGKTGLIEHCFHQKHIEKEYYIFLIDIYMRLRIFKSLFLSLAKEL